jgi:hypothetical protein
MNEEYFAKLEKAGNIGVGLGGVSDGLVTSDIDNEEQRNRFEKNHRFFMGGEYLPAYAKEKLRLPVLSFNP